MNVVIYINEKEISLSEIWLQEIETVEDIQLLLFKFDKVKYCQGSISSQSYPEIKKLIWHSVH